MSDIIISTIGPNVNSQFDELRVASKTPIIELTSVYGISDLRDVVTTTAGGTVTNNGTEYVISTASGVIDSATLASAARGRYEPGFAGEAGLGVRIPTNPVGNQIARWGLFDTQNGAFFGVNSANIFIAIRSAGFDTVVNQSSWNVDPLDGTGPSGATLTLSKGNIFQILFTWYGYGVIEFRVVMPNPVTLAQEVITVHRYSPTSATSLVDPNLPLRAEVSNNGTGSPFSFFVGGRQYNIVGKFAPTIRITSERRTLSNVTTTLTPVISFTRKADFPAGSGKINSVSVLLDQVNILADTQLSFQILLGGTLNGAFVNYPTATTIIPVTETALLVNTTSTTITGGETLYQGITSANNREDQVLRIADLLDLDLPINQSVTLAVARLDSNVSNTVNAVFRVTESW